MKIGSFWIWLLLLIYLLRILHISFLFTSCCLLINHIYLLRIIPPLSWIIRILWWIIIRTRRNTRHCWWIWVHSLWRVACIRIWVCITTWWLSRYYRRRIKLSYHWRSRLLNLVLLLKRGRLWSWWKLINILLLLLLRNHFILVFLLLLQILRYVFEFLII